MYDDDVHTPISLTEGDRYYRVARYPTRNIRTPIVLLYGEADSLVDIRVMLKELPQHTLAKGIPSFEHLDFLWAENVHQVVFPTVFEALRTYAGRSHVDRLKPLRMVHSDLGSADITTSSEDDASVRGRSVARSTLEPGFLTKYRAKIRSDQQLTASSPASSIEVISVLGDDVSESTKRLGPPLRTSLKHTRRNGSISSVRSLEVAKVKDAGISLGSSRPTTGTVNTYDIFPDQ